MVVTENGAAYPDPPPVRGRVDDRPRVDYLRRYLQATAEAIAQGCDVRGYFVWTLVDNFEWAEGFTQRFGIVHLDRETLRRTPKESFRFYQRVVAGGRLPDGPGGAAWLHRPAPRAWAAPAAAQGRPRPDPAVAAAGSARRAH